MNGSNFAKISYKLFLRFDTLGEKLHHSELTEDLSLRYSFLYCQRVGVNTFKAYLLCDYQNSLASKFDIKTDSLLLRSGKLKT